MFDPIACFWMPSNGEGEERAGGLRVSTNYHASQVLCIIPHHKWKGFMILT